MGRRRFFSYWEYLKEKEKISSKGETIYHHEADALAKLQTEDLLWHLAVRDDMPFQGINDVMRTPSQVLFQAAIIADINDRMIRKEKIRAAADQALQGAKRGRR